uniref:Uncharacterized protein n=1 Tax=Physcomitrium patens TaxID=3218 RepID=A0A7I4FTL7_PHYPA
MKPERNYGTHMGSLTMRGGCHGGQMTTALREGGWRTRGSQLPESAEITNKLKDHKGTRFVQRIKQLKVMESGGFCQSGDNLSHSKNVGIF